MNASVAPSDAATPVGGRDRAVSSSRHGPDAVRLDAVALGHRESDRPARRRRARGRARRCRDRGPRRARSGWGCGEAGVGAACRLSAAIASAAVSRGAGARRERVGIGRVGRGAARRARRAAPRSPRSRRRSRSPGSGASAAKRSISERSLVTRASAPSARRRRLERALGELEGALTPRPPARRGSAPARLPCETCIDWPGSPLPQLSTPESAPRGGRADGVEAGPELGRHAGVARVAQHAAALAAA